MEKGDETGKQSRRLVLFGKDGLVTIVTDQPNPVTKGQSEPSMTWSHTCPSRVNERNYFHVVEPKFKSNT